MTIPLLRNFSEHEVVAFDEQNHYTQGRLLAAADHLASSFPDSMYVINLCRKRHDFLVVFLATILSQRISLLPPNRNEADIRRLIDTHSNALVLVGSIDSLTTLPTVIRSPYLDEFRRSTAMVPSITTDQPVALAFTSGSTGQPIENLKNWGTLTTTARSLADRLFGDLTPSIVATVPSQHMYGLEMITLMAMYGGARIATKHPFFPKEIAQVLGGVDNPVLVTTPTHLRALVGAGINYRPLSKIISATAPLSLELAKAAEQRFSCELEEIYGCTEAGSIATRRTVETQDFQLLRNLSLTVSQDKALLSVPYIEAKVELSDVIKMTTDGFRLIGRSEDMLNVAGNRYSLIELSARIQDVPGVEDAVAFLPNNQMEIERPAALIVSNKNPRDVLRSLAESIDAAFLPRPIIRVDLIPRNATGKVQRSEIIEIFQRHEQ